eukprot:scaffold4568_cov74-Cyclotella_meneghiniana.AAC.21
MMLHLPRHLRTLAVETRECDHVLRVCPGNLEYYYPHQSYGCKGVGLSKFDQKLKGGEKNVEFGVNASMKLTMVWCKPI